MAVCITIRLMIAIHAYVVHARTMSITTRSNMRPILLLAACAAVLTGCAGTETAVRVRAAPGLSPGEHTYAFAESPPGVLDPDEVRWEAAVAGRLAQFGFVAAPAPSAQYRVALSHDTRLASVAVVDARCAETSPCGAPQPLRAPGFPWPGMQTYAHSLTLRFFDHADGREIYAVSATKRDREPSASVAIDALVASALARVPFQRETRGEAGRADADGATEWKVTLRMGDRDAEPRVSGVAPMPR